MAIIAGGIVGLIDVFGPSSLGKNIELSTIVVDRNGKLLRPYLTSDGRWRLACYARGRGPALSRYVARL